MIPRPQIRNPQDSISALSLSTSYLAKRNKGRSKRKKNALPAALTGHFVYFIAQQPPWRNGDVVMVRLTKHKLAFAGTNMNRVAGGVFTCQQILRQRVFNAALNRPLERPCAEHGVKSHHR